MFRNTAHSCAEPQLAVNDASDNHMNGVISAYISRLCHNCSNQLRTRTIFSFRRQHPSSAQACLTCIPASMPFSFRSRFRWRTPTTDDLHNHCQDGRFICLGICAKKHKIALHRDLKNSDQKPDIPSLSLVNRQLRRSLPFVLHCQEF